MTGSGVERPVLPFAHRLLRDPQHLGQLSLAEFFILAGLFQTVRKHN